MADFAYDGRDLEVMSFAKNYHAWILNILRPYLGVWVAEVGAGSGSFSELLLKEPITELVAVEPAREMLDRLTASAGSDPRVIPKNGFFADVSAEYPEHFDSVVYVNVLEHVPDDAEELRRVYGALKPGGRVCIFVPALPWLYSKHDRAIGHHRRYYKRELLSRMRAAGFEIEKARYFDIAGVIPWLVVFKWMKKNAGAGAVGLYDTVVVPIMRGIESIIPPPLGKNIIAVGKKPERPRD